MISLREIKIKNRGYYYSHDINNKTNIDLAKFLVHERPWQIIFIYCVAYKTLYGEKPLRISVDKVDGYIEK